MTVKRPSFPSRRVEFMKRNRAARKLAEKDKLARVSLPSQHIGKMNGRNDAAKLGEDDETDRATIDSQEQAGAVPSSAQQAVEALLTDEVNTHTVSDVARRDDDPDFDPQDMWTADIASLLSADPTNSPLPQRGPSSTAHTSASPKSVKKQPKLRHLLHRPRERNREASIGYFFHKIRRRQLWDTEVKKEEAPNETQESLSSTAPTSAPSPAPFNRAPRFPPTPSPSPSPSPLSAAGQPTLPAFTFRPPTPLLTPPYSLSSTCPSSPKSNAILQDATDLASSLHSISTQLSEALLQYDRLSYNLGLRGLPQLEHEEKINGCAETMRQLARWGNLLPATLQR
ncbi:hypothetical protein PSEUBRA_001004 [Kalmanozyma brasiliensis GHG001]|uniref:uncharacterized protein n=1 Tax=Kalmanozyma brasiliensis (strain GHG001) TaxID=1365824 RepID=UPI001CEBC42F|nr:uncharacterized protein PSEUBRA_001004 [Kalmanozyma brasiliensis GHG001]KAF6766875.1 hypothetical protein PSEUBRA_001004 [Kalmanozyma brasiliensis GHG001]